MDVRCYMWQNDVQDIFTPNIHHLWEPTATTDDLSGYLSSACQLKGLLLIIF